MFIKCCIKAFWDKKVFMRYLMKYAKNFSPLLFIFVLDTAPKEIEYKNKIQNIHYSVMAYLKKPFNLMLLKLLWNWSVSELIYRHLGLIENRTHSNFRCKNTELLRMLGFAATHAPSPAHFEYLRTFLILQFI